LQLTGFGHATRVNQIITELLKSTTSSSSNSSSSTGTSIEESTASSSSSVTTKSSRHTIYIVSDAPEFIFKDVTVLGAKYRNAKVDAGVVQPLVSGCFEFWLEASVYWFSQEVAA
jgi:L-arabinokinase